ncbi:MAG: AraC family transcriptional regulator, partial [Muribaculaceae bacterium]|nr:AraC family transcriptional regulator [Muribaculaceae bacterium]
PSPLLRWRVGADLCTRDCYRKVKVLTGMPPADYVKKFKLRKSVELLLSRDYNVTEIAFKTGFNSPEHYRGAFKDEYGMSPTQYFKKHREGH